MSMSKALSLRLIQMSAGIGERFIVSVGVLAGSSPIGLTRYHHGGCRRGHVVESATPQPLYWLVALSYARPLC